MPADDELIRGSSLGTPGARSLRARTPDDARPHDVEGRLRAALEDLEATVAQARAAVRLRENGIPSVDRWGPSYLKDAVAEWRHQDIADDVRH